MSDEQFEPGPLRAEPSDPSPPSDRPPNDDREREATLGVVHRRALMHEADRAPRIMLRGQAWLSSWFSNESRVLLGVVVVTVAVVGAIVVASLRIVEVALESLDVFVVLTLFLVNWLGNGGILVPIPGARFIGLLMVFQQAVMLPAWEVLLVAGAAMSLGLLSYYVAGARTAQSYAEGDEAGAEKIASDTGMSDDDRTEFSPGAGLDAELVSSIADLGRPADSPVDADGPTVAPEAGTAEAGSAEPARGWRSRFSTSLKRAQDRARPILEQRGNWGMFLLCFAPTPMGTAAAYLGGLMGFSFTRYLISSFAAKYLLTGIIVVLAFAFSDTARAITLPEITLPQFDLPEFDIGLFELPDFGPDATPEPTAAAAATSTPTD